MVTDDRDGAATLAGLRDAVYIQDRRFDVRIAEILAARGETDAALTRLVARQVVGLYAMTPDNSLRMNVEGSNIEFWPASVPGKFHEMDISTVPADVLAAYPDKHKTDVKWGVTLPADMARELDGYLSSTSGGSLVIASSGEIDLRR